MEHPRPIVQNNTVRKGFVKLKRKLPLNTVASFTHCAVRLRVTLNDDVVNFCHIICHVGKWLMLKMQKQLLFFYISTPQEEEIFLTIRVTIVIFL